MVELVQRFRLPLRSLVVYGQPIAGRLIQPLITVALLLFLYAGWHVRDEGSISDGLRVAFIDTRAFRAHHQREQEVLTLQTELRHAADTDRQVDQILAGLLARSPLADRIRLAVVHNGITGVTGIALLRYDITNSVAAPGRNGGPMVVNQPLSDWNEFLPILLNGRCYFGLTAEQSNTAIRTGFDSLGASTFLSCPVIDYRGRMLGATFLSWSGRELPPTGEPLLALMRDAVAVGARIGAVLDSRNKTSPLSAPAEAS